MRLVLRPLLTALLLGPLVAAAVPSTLTYQGRLFTPHGQPQSATPAIVFKLFAHETGGRPSWSESIANVPLTNGIDSFKLGDVRPFPENLFASDELWMELTVSGTTLSPRQPLTTVPFAFNAKNLQGGSVEATSVTTAGVKVDDEPVVLTVASQKPDQNGNVILPRASTDTRS